MRPTPPSGVVLRPETRARMPSSGGDILHGRREATLVRVRPEETV